MEIMVVVGVEVVLVSRRPLPCCGPTQLDEQDESPLLSMRPAQPEGHVLDGPPVGLPLTTHWYTQPGVDDGPLGPLGAEPLGPLGAEPLGPLGA